MVRATFLLCACLLLIDGAHGMTTRARRRGVPVVSRRTVAGGAASLVLLPRRAIAADISLSELLAKREPLLLKKPQFNFPPGLTSYPAWLLGEWDVSSKFVGYVFPKTKISKERVVANVDIPGFQKNSIAMLADVGHDPLSYRTAFFDNGKNVVEDRRRKLAATLAAHMDDAEIVTSVDYDPGKNPNRATINLREGSRNGERIELFINSRRQETTNTSFLCSESIRQVTLGGPTASNPNVARIVIGEYQHYWTYRRPDENGVVTGNILTAAYIEPQDPMFQEVFDLPVVIYSHNFQMTPAPPSSEAEPPPQA